MGTGLFAKGADLNLMMAEFYGKGNSYYRGRGGSMYTVDVDSGISTAVGVGIGLKMRADGRAFGASFGMLARFGPQRILDTPLTE